VSEIKLILGDCLEEMKKIPDKSIDLVLTDPPYQEGFEKQFALFQNKLKENGQILWFVQPTELYDMPRPFQVLVWNEPISPKPIRKKYREFLDFICWYPQGDYTFNKLMWNLMNSRFNDEVIRDKRLVQWEKPKSMIEKLLLIHTNNNDTILDPFMGSGTTGVACKELGRNFIGIEISPEYFKIAERRINNTSENLET
jgi:site-specific DNA-methyltransferase (adenine-specific)